jgi:hypothetical protein
MNKFEYRQLGRLTNVLMVLLLAGALVGISVRRFKPTLPAYFQ